MDSHLVNFILNDERKMISYLYPNAIIHTLIRNKENRKGEGIVAVLSTF